MEPKDIAALLALMRVEGAGNTVARRALETARSLAIPAGALPDTDPRELLQLSGDNALVNLVAALKQVDNVAVLKAERHVDRLLQHGATCFTFADADYPALLERYLGDAAPALIWGVGNLDLLYDFSAGIVGTRAPSPTGHAIAGDCARLFIREGACVVSGGADGIDTAAHRAALEGGGTSIIVLPQGLRTYTFPSYVREALESHRCAIISQFDPEMTWQTHAAVTRNATIAALAKLVCVVEPRRMGGSMRTAKHAREQGKAVFYYCSVDGENFAKIFRQSNANPLLNFEGALSEGEIHRIWRTVLPGEPSQADLL